MSERDLALLLRAEMREVAREVFNEESAALAKGRDELGGCEEAARLRAQLVLIKAKEHVTVKEAALLLSCSESHIRKLVGLSRKGKSRRPLPFVDIEGVTVFPLDRLLEWASPEPPARKEKQERARLDEAA